MSGNKISLSLGSARKAPPPTNGVKRSRAVLHDEGDESSTIGQAETVSHFDPKAGGAVDASKKKEETGPLTIAPQANQDWREKSNQRKRQKSGLPEGQNGNRETLDARMRDVEARVEASKPKFGLNTYKTSESGQDEAMSGTGDVSVAKSPQPEHEQEQQHDVASEAPRARTDDELALDALLGKTSTNTTMIIGGKHAPMTEEDAFDHDVASAPDMATLDDYARVPVEQFGAALLRGMGWKDGEGIGSQKGKKLAKDTGKLPERRAALLGIGAKENAAVAQEMGAWGKASRGKDAKVYNPILIRDKKTGKTYTEEELEKKKKEDERRKYEMEFEKKEMDRKRKEDQYESRDRRKRKRRDDSRDGARSKDDRRDPEGSRRHQDSESEEEYRRRKEKERRRKRERDDDYDRESSRRHRDRDDSGRDGRHDKDRRDRDRGHERDRRR